MFITDTINALFGGPRKMLGLDIGTTSIKIVELSRKGEHALLTNYGLLETTSHSERSNQVLQSSSFKISENEAVALLSILLQKIQCNTKNVVASIPTFASFMTLSELPEMNAEDTTKAMGFSIQQSIPLPLSEVAIDWVKVGRRVDDTGNVKQQILVVAIPNEIIARYKAICKRAGLSLQALEVEALAYTRAIIGGDKTPSLLLDIGDRSSNISIVDQGFLKHTTQIDYGGDSLTTSIAKGMGIGFSRAESLKRQRGIIQAGQDFGVGPLATPYVDLIVNQVQKVIQGFQSEWGVMPARVLLLGGGASLLGLSEYVEERLKLPTVLGNGLLYVTAPANLHVLEKELQTRFATAVGIGIKGLL